MRVLDLVGEDFYIPKPEMASRYRQKFVIVSGGKSLERRQLERILLCADFDSVEKVSFDCNDEHTAFAVFYKD